MLAEDWSQHPESTQLLHNVAAAGLPVATVRNSRGQTPLHRAACKCVGDAARLLLALGAQPNAVDSEGSTPLHLLNAEQGVELLIEGPWEVENQLGLGARRRARARRGMLRGAGAARSGAALRALLAGP